MESEKAAKTIVVTEKGVEIENTKFKLISEFDVVKKNEIKNGIICRNKNTDSELRENRQNTIIFENLKEDSKHAASFSDRLSDIDMNENNSTESNINNSSNVNNISSSNNNHGSSNSNISNDNKLNYNANIDFNENNNKNEEIEIWTRVTPSVDYVKLVIFKGKVVGALLVGDTGLEEVFENLILNQMDVSHVGIDLLDPSLDLEDYFD